MNTENKGFDPGWNDPPIFSYAKATEIQSNIGRKSLNKRVAFPLSGGPQRPTSTGVDPTLPPTAIDPGAPPADASLILPTQPTSLPNEVVETVPINERLQDVLCNFGTVHNLDSNDEIAKRINIMANMWRDGKFDSSIQLRLLKLSEALSTGDSSTADQLQKSLMVDYVSICSSWMGGVRQLINLSRNDR